MKRFKARFDVTTVPTLTAYFEAFPPADGDFILTNEFLFEAYIKPLNLPVGSLFIEQFGRGEPTDEMVDRIRQNLPAGVRHMIAVGGGSVMDIAKMLSVKAGDSTRDFFDGVAPLRQFTVTAIPTTAGTGSEVTNAVSCYLTHLKTKRGINHDLLYPEQSVLIPELMSGLPYRFFITAAVDALVHAMESYLSPQASAHSMLFSQEAIRLLLRGFVKMEEKGLEARSQDYGDYLLASNYAGLAFCSAGCAAVHALSYPLGGNYHIPHGEANQLVFAATFKLYLEKKPQGRISQLKTLVAEYLNTTADQAFERLFGLLNQLGTIKPLREYGVEAAVLPEMAANVYQNQTRLLANNYVPISEAEMLAIYQSIY